MPEMLSISPAFKTCDKCIVFSANNSFVACTSVMIQSIIENSRPEHLYDIIIIYTSINQLNQSILCSMCDGYDNISIRCFNIDRYIKDTHFYTQNRASLSKEAYYRLFIPWLLDDSYHLSLYMDGDMVVERDLVDIFSIDLNDCLIAGVRDYWGICNCYIPGENKKSERMEIGLPNFDDYIISATLIFNLDLFRKKYQLNDIYKYISQRNWLQHDQDIINVMCKDSIVFLSPTWGFMSDYGNNHYLPQYLLDELSTVGDHPDVIHFGGGRKPWKFPYKDFDLIFWKYARHSPYFSFLLNGVLSNEYKNDIAYRIAPENICTYVSENGVERYCGGVSLGNVRSGHTRYRVITISNGILHLEGMAAFFCVGEDAGIKVWFRINNELLPASSQMPENGTRKDREGITYRGESFTFDYDLRNIPENGIKIGIECELNGIYFEKSNLGFEKFSPLNRKYRHSYYFSENWSVTTDLHCLFVRGENEKSREQLEKELRQELKSTGKKAAQKAVLARSMADHLKRIFKKPVWLISDRLMRADDNGEAFFRYVCENHKKEISPFFIISRNSPDYERLRKIGPVVEPYSHKHKLLQLIAAYSVSSQTDELYRNPFGRFSPAYSDMLNQVKFVFLQHGIISNDLSGWLCRRRQNMTGFITSTPREYQSVLTGNYGYTEKELWLTGLPRFDYLQDTSEKCITVMPTWRRFLAVGQDKETGIWKLKNDFRDSAYVAFYRNLLQNPVLRRRAKELGYRIQFKIHPSFLTHEKDFGFDSEVIIADSSIPYREIYSKSRLIVSDYSSSIYDFIYLRKPIIYCQFDLDEMISGGHMWESEGFDYESQGFGDVTYTLEDTIRCIIEYMENDCRLKDIYRARIDQEFKFSDRKNCERIYKKMIQAVFDED